MAENLYRFIWSWVVCVVVTIAVSLVTTPKPVTELQGLVWGIADIPEGASIPVYRRPWFAALILAAVFSGIEYLLLVDGGDDTQRKNATCDSA